MPRIAKLIRPLGSVFLSALLAVLPGSPLFGAAAAEDRGLLPSVFDDRVRSDRADFGFKAFLEIRGHEGTRALRIVEVRSTGAAGRAGLRPGDLVLAIAGTPFPQWENDLERVLDLDLKFLPGEGVPFLVQRGRELLERTIAPDAMSVAVQQELIRCVAAASATLSEGRPLYCHDIRRNPGDIHYVCEDDPSSLGSEDCSGR
ncbi:MAG: PDZ domain-containing protein [Acidobacteriota bacterium]